MIAIQLPDFTLVEGRIVRTCMPNPASLQMFKQLEQNADKVQGEAEKQSLASQLSMLRYHAEGHTEEYNFKFARVAPYYLAAGGAASPLKVWDYFEEYAKSYGLDWRSPRSRTETVAYLPDVTVQVEEYIDKPEANYISLSPPVEVVPVVSGDILGSCKHVFEILFRYDTLPDFIEIAALQTGKAGIANKSPQNTCVWRFDTSGVVTSIETMLVVPNNRTQRTLLTFNDWETLRGTQYPRKVLSELHQTDGRISTGSVQISTVTELKELTDLYALIPAGNGYTLTDSRFKPGLVTTLTTDGFPSFAELSRKHQEQEALREANRLAMNLMGRHR